MKYKNSNNIAEYLEWGKIIYYTFLENGKLNFEKRFPNCILDFDHWVTFENGTGYANIWVEPTQKHFYTPQYKSPYSNIEIGGLRIQVKIKILESEGKNKIVRFQISGLYNPQIWLGRNSLTLQPMDKIILTGYDRIIVEEDLLFSSHIIKYISQNFDVFMRETLKFYGFQERMIINYN